MSVLVTGSARGIGAAIAAEFSAAGELVAVADLDEAAARQHASQIKGLGLAIDVTNRASIERAAAAAERELGPITVWVSNAGVSTMEKFLDVSEKDWDFVMDVNAKGPFLCGQVAGKLMQSRGGAIVNLASLAGKRGGIPYLAHYVASKFAVVGLTQAMAYELAPYGIRVNCVCPGYVQTSMQSREIEWETRLRGMTKEQVLALYHADVPLGRLETPEDVAKSVSFLASDSARYITGEALAVHGGSYMD
jgi:meso-butanediol dehydrogenase / (S,S)-butanediol dehydrogenase / diacetyl reductase